jgi:hypothetical protein
MSASVISFPLATAELKMALSVLRDEAPITGIDLHDAEQYAVALEQFACEVERIAKSANEAGLIGFERACFAFKNILQSLAELGDVTVAEHELLIEWPGLAADYAEKLLNGEALVSILTESCWRKPLS